MYLYLPVGIMPLRRSRRKTRQSNFYEVSWERDSGRGGLRKSLPRSAKSNLNVDVSPDSPRSRKSRNARSTPGRGPLRNATEKEPSDSEKSETESEASSSPPNARNPRKSRNGLERSNIISRKCRSTRSGGKTKLRSKNSRKRMVGVKLNFSPDSSVITITDDEEEQGETRLDRSTRSKSASNVRASGSTVTPRRSGRVCKRTVFLDYESPGYSGSKRLTRKKSSAIVIQIANQEEAAISTHESTPPPVDTEEAGNNVEIEQLSFEVGVNEPSAQAASISRCKISPDIADLPRKSTNNKNKARSSLQQQRQSPPRIEMTEEVEVIDENNDCGSENFNAVVPTASNTTEAVSDPIPSPAQSQHSLMSCSSEVSPNTQARRRKQRVLFQYYAKSKDTRPCSVSSKSISSGGGGSSPSLQHMNCSGSESAVEIHGSVPKHNINIPTELTLNSSTPPNPELSSSTVTVSSSASGKVNSDVTQPSATVTVTIDNINLDHSYGSRNQSCIVENQAETPIAPVTSVIVHKKKSERGRPRKKTEKCVTCVGDTNMSHLPVLPSSNAEIPDTPELASTPAEVGVAVKRKSSTKERMSCRGKP